MASFWKKIVSGLDWWDKDENRNQREAFAREDEKERERRRQIQQQQQFNRPDRSQQVPGLEFSPDARVPDPTVRLSKIGSQSQFTLPDAPPKPQGGGFLNKAGTTLGLTTARVGTGIAQGVGGLVDILGPSDIATGAARATGLADSRLGKWLDKKSQGSNRLSKATTKLAEDIDATAKAEGVEKAYKILNVPMEAVTYAVPGVGAAKAAKLPGIGKTIASTAARLRKYGDDITRNASEGVSGVEKFFDRVGREGVREVLNPTNIAQEARLTGRYLGQDVAQGEEVTPGLIAQSAGASLFGSLAAPTVVRGVGNLLRKATSNSIRTLPDEPPKIPGTIESPVAEVPATPVSPGVKSTNLPKVAAAEPPRVPDVTSPVTLAKADTPVPQPDTQPPPPPTPTAPLAQPLQVPLQKAPQSPIPQVETAPANVVPPAAVVQPPRQVDAEGNPVMVSDVQAANQLADDGLAPQRGDSPLATTEAELEKARAEAEAEQVNLADPLEKAIDNENIFKSEISDLRNQAGNDEVFYDKVILNNVETEGDIGNLARHVARRVEANGENVSDVLDDTLRLDTPQSRAVEAESIKLSERNELAKTIRDLERSTNQKGLYQKVAENMADMNLDEQIEYMSKALTDMRERGVLAMDYLNKQSGSVPPTTADDAILPEGFAPAPEPEGFDFETGTRTTPGRQFVAGETGPAQSTRTVPPSGPDVTAPRTRDELIDDVNDPILQGEMAAGASQKNVVNLKEAKEEGVSRTRQSTDEQLINDYTKSFRMQGPEDGYAALTAKERLSRIDTPEARQAVVNITNAIADKSSESGLWLNFTQVLFDTLDPKAKTDILIDDLNKAGASLGDKVDEVRAELLRRVELADEASNKLRQVNDLITEAKANMESGVLAGDEATKIIETLSARRAKFEDAHKLANGSVNDYFDQHIPKGKTGARVSHGARLAMLTSPFGRAFDLIATGASAVTKTFDVTNAALLGKVGNKLTKPGTFESTLPSPSAPFKAAPKALRKVKDDWAGRRRVDNISEELKRKSRSDIKHIGGPASRRIRALVETPTELTRYVEDESLISKGVQDAQKLGIPKADQKNYARLYAMSATNADKKYARQEWFKVNAIHDNKLTDGLNAATKLLDKIPGGWGGMIKNLTVPFISFFGGNANLAFKDRNVFWNAYSAKRNFDRGNPQEALKDLGRLGTNTVGAIAAGALLVDQGILTDKDANGNTYDGVYIKLGDRYMPVAIAGQFAPALILGYSLNRGFDAENPIEGAMTALATATFGVMKSTDVAATFGGENSLAKRFDEVTKLGAGDEDIGRKALEIGAKLGGDITRQYIPAITGDINSALNMNKALNPTGEASETKVTYENPETGRQKTNVAATEWNKIKDRIPFLSQSLDRKEGTPARDVIDRISKGTHETSEMADTKAVAEVLKDTEKQLRKEGVPLKVEEVEKAVKDGEWDKAVAGWNFQLAKKEADPKASEKDKAYLRDKIVQATLGRDDISTEEKGIEARIERGEYDKALKGMEYRYNKMKDDKDVPDRTEKGAGKLDLKDEITRITITRDKNFPPEAVSLYKSISNSAWRNMINPDHDDYDPKTAGLLEAYDKELATAGVSRYDKDSKKTKYFEKGVGGEGGGGGRGGAGKKLKYSTDIALNKFSEGGGFTPIKPQKATLGPPQSAIPTLEKVPSFDRSKLRKITVSRGR